MDKLSVKQVVVCEDIRREFNGKEILIGVYGSNIAVATFPATLVLAFWVQVFLSEVPTSPVSLDFRLMGDNEVQFSAVTAQVFIPRAGLGSFGLPAIPLSLQIPTKLLLQLKQESGEWETVAEVIVEKGVVAMPPGMPAGFPVNPR